MLLRKLTNTENKDFGCVSVTLFRKKSLFYFTETGITHKAETRRVKSTFIFNLAFDEDRKTQENIFVILHLDVA